MTDKEGSNALDLLAALGDQLQANLTPDDLGEIIRAAVAEAKGDGPAGSKARNFLLALLRELTSEELEQLRGDKKVMDIFREPLPSQKRREV